MSDDVEKVRSRINIVDVIGRRVNLKKTGRAFSGLCPFHDDKNPSMSVNPTLGTYRCWSCGAKGDVFKFVMEMDKLTFREALEQLADEAGVVLAKKSGGPESAQKARRQLAMDAAQEFFVAQLQKSEPAKKYCESRGLDAATLKDWGLGYGPEIGAALATQLQKAGHNLHECQELFLVDKDPVGGFYDRFRSRLMFPIHDDRGRLVAFGGRIIGTGIPKYINSSDTPLFSKRRTLYGMHRARQAMAERGRAVLVEGYLDVIACHRAGVTDAVASLGTSLSEEHAEMIKRWAKEAVILYDADEAGQKAADRAEQILRAAGLAVRIALMPPGEDPDTLLRTAGPEAIQKAVEGGLAASDFRMAQLKKRLQPSQDEFWSEAFAILAQATSDLEVERHLNELAGLYPGIHDRIAAAKVIRKEIVVRRKALRMGGQDLLRAQGNVRIPRAPLHAYETTVLRGLLNPQTFIKAYDIVKAQLFFTGSGIVIAENLVALWGDSPPRTAPSQWVPELDESLQEAFQRLEAKALIDISAEALNEVRERLQDRAAERRIHDIRSGGEKGDDELLHIQKELHRLKNKESQ